MDKYSGGLALGAHAHGAGTDVASALETAVVGDVLCAADGDGNAVHLLVRQDAELGGVRLEPVEDAGALHADAIARSQMHSMLADRARVSKYAAALAATVRPASHVLDIGAGTALLALLAARAGAAHVAAAEMYAPLAALAAATAAENGLSDVVAVHPKPSTALAARRGGHLPRRADVLVTEIFDSALLGEACLPSLAHAHAHLLTPDAAVIPARARLFAQVVASPLFRSFHALAPSFPFHRSPSGPSCAGGALGTPVHVGALHDRFAAVTAPFEVFAFPFSRAVLDLPDRRAQFALPRVAPGRADAVVTWWELDLVPDGSVRYSSAPGAEPWQDHWLPVVYPLPCAAVGGDEEGPTIALAAGHDAARVWFSADASARSARPCSCGFHLLPGGAGRVAALGDAAALAALRARVAAAVNAAPGPVLDLSDGSVCALLAAAEMKRQGRTHAVVSLESHEFSRHLYAQAERRAHAAIDFQPDLAAAMEAHKGFAAVLSEPFYHATLNRPVQTFSNLLVQLRALHRAGHLRPDARFVPASAQMTARVVRFQAGEDPFVRAPPVVAGVKHAAFAQLCAAATPAAARLHLPLYMHKHSAGKEVALVDVQLGGTQEHTHMARKLTAPAGAGRAAVAVRVRYDEQPVPQLAHDLLIPLPPGVPGGQRVTVSAAWDAQQGEWALEVAIDS